MAYYIAITVCTVREGRPPTSMTSPFICVRSVIKDYMITETATDFSSSSLRHISRRGSGIGSIWRYLEKTIYKCSTIEGRRGHCFKESPPAGCSEYIAPLFYITEKEDPQGEGKA